MIYHAVDVTSDSGDAMGFEGKRQYDDYIRLCRKYGVEYHIINGKRHSFVVFAWTGLEGDLTRELAVRVATQYARQYDNGTLRNVDLRRTDR